MLPLRDSNPTRRPAILTGALIAINLVAFLVFEPIGATEVRQVEFFACAAAIPYEVTHGETILDGVRKGRVAPSLISDAQTRGCPEKSVMLSILFSMFLHGGWLHIIGNMLYLWVFGNNVEDTIGRPRYLIFYLACGFAATMVQSFFSPGSTVPLIGASGAVAGVLGAYLLLFPRHRVLTLVVYFAVDLPAVVVLGGWFILQVFSGVGSVSGSAGGVAYWAHIGGFLTGIILLFVLRRPRRSPAPQG